MANQRLHNLIQYFSALVWFANGFFCKVLNLVPRHEQIVGRILGETYARPLTLMIGMSEIAMAIWILSRIKERLNAITQIVVVATMNVMEFLLVPDLLLWGKFNSAFACCFIALVYYNHFIMKPS